MIYQDVKRFLKRYLNKPTQNYEWIGRDNFVFLDYIQSRYSDEQIDNNVMEVRQAFRDFFEPVGSLIVRFSRSTGITYKIMSYSVKPEQSKHLKKLVSIIQENRRSVEYPYNGKEDQIALLGKIRRKINAEIIETDEKINKKELVRYAIKKAMDLDERDVVLNLKKKFVIKLFNKNSFINSTDKEEQVYQNCKAIKQIEEEVKHSYEEIFKEISIIDFLDGVMVSLFVGKLNFQKINNNYYEKNSLSLIKHKIMEDLGEYFSENEEYIGELASYILKENLINIHERIAIEIFEQITNKNENSKDFLNYYTGQIYVEEGKRYIIPEITTQDGKRWNINSLMSTSTVWLRSRALLIKLKVQMQNINQKISENMPFHDGAKHQLDKKTVELNNVLKQYKEYNQKVEQDTIRLKDEEKGSMNKDKEIQLRRNMQNDRKVLNELRRKINELRLSKTELTSTYDTCNTTIVEFKQKQQSILSQIQSLEQDLNLNSNAFHSILSSVVKALIKRKKRIEK